MSADNIVGLNLVFTKSSDFYGRITMYKLDVLGQRAV